MEFECKEVHSRVSESVQQLRSGVRTVEMNSHSVNRTCKYCPAHDTLSEENSQGDDPALHPLTSLH